MVENSTALRLGWTDRIATGRFPLQKRHSDWMDLAIVGGINPVHRTMALMDERHSHEVTLPSKAHVPVHDIGASLGSIRDIFGYSLTCSYFLKFVYLRRRFTYRRILNIYQAVMSNLHIR